MATPKRPSNALLYGLLSLAALVGLYLLGGLMLQLGNGHLWESDRSLEQLDES